MAPWVSLLLFFVPLIQGGPPRSTTHEEIREAIISLAHHLQVTAQKLERHELREKQLGDQLKKALSALDTRERAQETKFTELNLTLNHIEDNLKRIEAGLTKRKDEQEKGMYTIDTMPLQSWMSNVEVMLNKQQNPTNELFLNKDKLERIESVLSSKIDSMTAAIERLESQVIDSNSKSISKDLLTMFDSHQLAQDDKHGNLMSAIDRNAKLLFDIQNANNAELYNATKSDLEKIKHDLTFLTNNIPNVHQNLQQGIQTKFTEMYNSLDEIKGMMNGYFSEMQGKQEDLSKDVRSLTKVEPAILDTADNVMDTKRRVEYGVHEIVMELSDVVKNQGKELNETVNRRFNDISATILENQNGGLSNLSSKIEMEISQVWRQIGIMYKQLTDSTGALEKLQKQTEKYVNGSLSTMDSMDGQVGEITGRVSDVKENLNYLMGRLLLVTQEFNQTKSALATAFENLRKTFKNVQEEVKTVGPGPIPIDSDIEDNKL